MTETLKTFLHGENKNFFPVGEIKNSFETPARVKQPSIAVRHKTVIMSYQLKHYKDLLLISDAFYDKLKTFFIFFSIDRKVGSREVRDRMLLSIAWERVL